MAFDQKRTAATLDRTPCIRASAAFAALSADIQLQCMHKCIYAFFV